MKGIFIAKWQGLRRNPWTMIVMIGMSIVFALIVGWGNVTKITVPTFANTELDSVFLGELEKNKTFTFEWMSEEELTEQLRKGKREFGVVLGDDDFQVIVGIDSPNVRLIYETIRQLYVKHAQLNVIVGESGDAEWIAKKIEEQPLFLVETTTFQGENAFIYDSDLRPMFGYSLFFVIMTISYSVFQILLERKNGVWDRMILSPVRKWEMYSANLLYSFLVGYVQILLVFLVFRYVVKVDFHGSFLTALIALIPYVLAIVSLAIFITGIVGSVQQFNATIPIVSVSMAMIGGAFWPLEVVESNFMLTMSRFIPLTYGLEVLSGVTTYGHSLAEMSYPISILLLMSVLFAGLGIHFMEKRYVS